MGDQVVKDDFRGRGRGTLCRAWRDREKILYSVQFYSNCLFNYHPRQTVSSLQVEQGLPCEHVFCE